MTTTLRRRLPTRQPVLRRRRRRRRGGTRRGHGRGAARPDRRLGERRVHLGVRAVQRDQRRTSTGGSPRSATSATCTAPWPRCTRMKPRDRGTIVQVGLGAGLPRHPAADRVLRRQTRHPGLPRGAALRTAARAQRRARHHGADAGGEHPAVLLGAVPAAPPRAAGAADLPTRGRRPRRRCTPPTTRGAASTGSAPAPRHPGRRTRSPPACWTATWPGPGSTRSRPAEPRTRTAPVNLWEPADGQAGQGLRRARRSSTTGAHGATRSCGPRSTTACWRPWPGGAAAGTAAVARAGAPLTTGSGLSPARER